MGVNLNAADRSTIARTRGGPGVYGNAQRSHLGVPRERRAAARCRPASSRSTRPTAWAPRSPTSARTCQLSPDVVPVGQRRASLEPQPRRVAVGREDRRRAATSSAGSIRRPSASPARLNYTVTPTLSIQIYAEPFVSAGDYSNFKELVDGRSKSYEGRYAPIAYAGQSRLQLPLVPDDQRAALGIQARLDAVRRLAAGPRGHARPRHVQLRPRLRRRLRRAGATTCSWSSGRTG